MYRGSQILTWSCPIRSLLLREALVPALSEHTSAVLQGVRHAKKSKSKEGLSLATEAVSCSTQLSVFSLDSDNHHVSENLVSSRHQPLQVSSSLQSKQVSDPQKWTVAEDSSQNPEDVSSYKDYLTNTTCSQPWRRPWDICQVSISCTNKTDYNLSQSHLCYRRHLVGLSTHASPSFSQPRASCLFLQQMRAIHQAAPRMVDAWRDCLSLENETRCRQSLEPNLKLYQVEKERKALSQSQGKNQGRWASVLVSLCSVEGEPAFLFTLRSSTLKGRHKGDVSFAGGKSDPSDRDVVATALREAWEELGINVATERVWGVLKPLRDMSGMTIAPVLANLGPLEKLSFKPNPGEVEEIFTLSLSHLCNPQNCGYTHFRTGDKYGYTLPVFRNGKHRVWGLTAVALAHTLKLIVPP